MHISSDIMGLTADLSLQKSSSEVCDHQINNNMICLKSTVMQHRPLARVNI